MATEERKSESEPERERERLKDLLDQLNAGLGDVTPYKLALVPPGEILLLTKNAHYMNKRTYEQLTANVKRDGNLSSLPFCWKRPEPDGRFECLSGNHRVETARDAKTPLILILYTDANLSRPERVAIQLSHNALVGEDNPQVLRELWTEIADLSLKVYSGLDDKLLETLAPVPLSRIDEADVRMETLDILFFPSEVVRVKDVVARLGRAAENKPRLAARIQDFNRFFDVLLTFKEAKGILNTGTALLAMLDIVEEWLAANAAKQDGTDRNVT